MSVMFDVLIENIIDTCKLLWLIWSNGEIQPMQSDCYCRPWRKQHAYRLLVTWLMPVTSHG